MRKTFILLSVLFCMHLTGCTTTQTLPPETKYVAVTPDDNLLIDCDIEAPPNKVAYLANYGSRIGNGEVDMLLNQLDNMRERESMLIRMGAKQMQNIKVCNARLNQLRLWKARVIIDINNTQKKE